MLGFGPLQTLLDDPTVSEVMVNGPNMVFVERNGKLHQTDVRFENDDAVLRIIDKIILPLGRSIDADNPTVDARLPDGSRVNAVIPPVAIDGPSITIRKFMKDKLIDGSIGSDWVPSHKGMAELLQSLCDFPAEYSRIRWYRFWKDDFLEYSFQLHSIK